MISPELEAEMLRLFHAEKWLVGTIATQLGVHHSVVERVIAQDGESKTYTRRRRLIDPYLPFINDTLKKYPRLRASRLFEMVKERGYRGKPSQFRALIARLRPRPSAEAYLRLRTLPGEQAQVDWALFGRLQIGRASRQLVGFVMVLSYSRAIFLEFFLSQTLSCFLCGHESAFGFFAGHSRVILYDNLKSAVLERVSKAIRFNPQFYQFAGHYRFEPRPVAVGRGNEKGRVERAIGFIRSSFFAARKYKDLDDLNRQAQIWCQGPAMERRWPEDPTRSVRDAFLQEQKSLLPLPDDPYPCHERAEVTVGKTPYVRFDLNDYSVPHTLVRKTLVVVATQKSVRILDGSEVVATHWRSYDRAQQIEDPRHVETLRQEKAAAGKHSRAHLLGQVAPSTHLLLERLAQRRQPIGRATNELLELLRTHGAVALEAAVAEALQANVPHPQAVRHILERYRREAGKRPALPLPLPHDPRLENLSVRPHDLQIYDQIQERSHEENADDA